MITNKKVLQHFLHPHNVGFIESTQGSVFTGIAGTREQGSMIQLQLIIDLKTNHISKAYFKSYGCPYTIAVCSLLTEQLNHQSVAEAENIEHSTLIKALDLPENKLSSAILAIKALKSALKSYEENNEYR